jgi:hypothetical protein
VIARVLAVTMLTFLAVVPVAEACGWVVWVWVKPLPSGRLFWNIEPSAFETKAECDADARRRRVENVNETNRKFDERYYCFPGGTDPREREMSR